MREASKNKAKEYTKMAKKDAIQVASTFQLNSPPETLKSAKPAYVEIGGNRTDATSWRNVYIAVLTDCKGKFGDKLYGLRNDTMGKKKAIVGVLKNIS
jgi:hypothetical protein